MSQTAAAGAVYVSVESKVTQLHVSEAAAKVRLTRRPEVLPTAAEESASLAFTAAGISTFTPTGRKRWLRYARLLPSHLSTEQMHYIYYILKYKEAEP